MFGISLPASLPAGALATVALVFLAMLFSATTTARAAELSAGDRKNAKSALEYIDRRDWNKSRAHIKRIGDGLLKDVVWWHFLKSPGSPGKHKDISAFLKKRPDWPMRSTLVKRAEQTMDTTLSASSILDSIAEMGGPISATGRIRHGEALMKTGQKDAGALTIRAAWVDGDFSVSEEKSIYRRHRKLFTTEDNLKRLDRLIWEKRSGPAKRQVWRVSEAQRKLAIARIWLMRREGNVDKAIADVPHELKSDPALLYERLRWRRRNGRLDGAIEILDAAPDIVPHPEKWWVERAYLSRQALSEKRIDDAYRVAARHSLPKSSAREYSDAEWMAGWIALSFLDRADLAEDHFANMLSVVNFPVSIARGGYWSGRAAEKLENSKNAEKFYQLAASHPTTFYGQLAMEKLGMGKNKSADARHLVPEPVSSPDESARVKGHQLARAIRMLGELGEEKRLRPFVMALSRMGSTDGWPEAVAKIAESNGRADLALLVRKNSHQNGVPLGERAYPEVDLPKPARGYKVETPLVLAVIRQESAFYTGAKSGAGARGLMQVMPATARVVARGANIKYSRSRLLSDARYNLVIGQTYLASLIDDFDGSYVLSLAAYNAGPHRAKRWIKRHGDPRANKIDYVDWIEMIPFTETRTYVQRVMGNLNVYRRKMGGDSIALNNQ